MLKLSIMMFLQFFIWGSWYLTVSLFMIKNQMEDGAYGAYTAGPIAAIVTPFIFGLFVDRFFQSQKVLAGLFVAGGLVMLSLPFVGAMQGTEVVNQLENGQTSISYTVTVLGMTVLKSTLFNWIIFFHMCFYMPTLGLTASLSFHHLPKGSTQFPLVRLWGTMGWIVAGLVLAMVFTSTGADGQPIEAGTLPVQFYLGGIISIALGLFCLTLPRTPAPKKGQPFSLRDVFFMDAWREFRRPSFAVFMICSFLVCIPLAAYYASVQQQMNAMAMTHVTIWKNVGTWIEAGMMFMMPFFFRKLGIKKMIAIGIFAWAIRYVAFSVSAGFESLPDVFLANGDANPEYPGMIIGTFGIPYYHLGFLAMLAGVALHGFCYDFFFVTGQVYVDTATPKSIRGQAQSMNIFFTQGLGLAIGAQVAGRIATKAFVDGSGNKVSQVAAESLPYWPNLWWPLCGMALVVLVVFLVLFKETGKIEASSD